MSKQKHLGVFIAAAFIGPGTVTTCTLAGVDFGIELLWALTISIVITYYFQEIAARLGWVLNEDLDQIIMRGIKQPPLRFTVLGLIVSSIFIGNAAYQGGNLSGTLMGLQLLSDQSISKTVLMILIGLGVLSMLWNGRFELIKRLLMLLVVLMGISFLITAIYLGPGILTLLKAAFIPAFKGSSTLMIVALVGTTVVPYNLFLHTALVKQSRSEISTHQLLKKDALLSILIGGLISMAILVTAASAGSEGISSVIDLAAILKPSLGEWSKYIVGFGLFAAGFTSSITAPLAAGLVTASVFRSNEGVVSERFSKLAAILVFAIGWVVTMVGSAPIEIIKFAQIANGILLPVVAITLFILSRNKSLLGELANTKGQNILGIILVLFTLILGLMGLSKALGL
jgi:NRAMP (natural resistance-associated macrophage protein)-like metal ion transporter